MSQPSSERWLPVVGWEGLYEVSDHGRVRSLDRVFVDRMGRTVHLKGRVLRPGPNHKGYLRVNLRAGGRLECKFVHHCVLEAFVGPRPQGYIGCHWDDDHLYNHASNLRWATYSDNQYDRVRNGTHAGANKTHCLRGHRFVAGSYYVTNFGARSCKKCYVSRYKEKKARLEAAEIEDDL